MLYCKQSGPENIWLTAGTALVTLILGFLGRRLTAPPQATLSTLLQPAALDQVRSELSASEVLRQLYPEDVARATQALPAASQAASQQAPQAVMEAHVVEVRTALTSLGARLPQSRLPQ